MSDREFKGKSLICLPEDYVVIDIETTGLDYDYCSIIEISAVWYSGGEKCGVFSSLVKPPSVEMLLPDENDGGEKWVTVYVDDFITKLTGITNEMLKNAPEPEEVLPEFLYFIGDSILIGHNVNFDINFLYDAAVSVCNKPLSNNFVDTMRIARKCFPQLSHHRLKDVAQECGVEIETAHRAEADCETTAKCYRVMRESILGEMTEEEFIRLFSKKRKTYADSLSGITPTVDEIDETNPLYGKHIVFTGALSSMSRKEAFQIVVNLGAVTEDTITKKTNYLIVGSAEFIKSVKEGKTNKMKKAETYMQKGQDITVLSENTFMQMLRDWEAVWFLETT